METVTSDIVKNREEVRALIENFAVGDASLLRKLAMARVVVLSMKTSLDEFLHNGRSQKAIDMIPQEWAIQGVFVTLDEVLEALDEVCCTPTD